MRSELGYSPTNVDLLFSLNLRSPEEGNALTYLLHGHEVETEGGREMSSETDMASPRDRPRYRGSVRTSWRC